MQNVTLIFVVIFLCAYNVEGMSRAQLKKTLGVMKKQCMPKIGVTEDKVSKIEQGVFLEERNVMCYITCVYKTLQVMKNDRLNKALVLRQVDALYPAEMKPFVKKSIEACFSVQDKYEDTCEAVFYAAKCLYEYDPENFIFP